jgi:hypothetical protein
MLECQIFIELIKLEKIDDAISFAQCNLSKYKKIGNKEKDYLEKVSGLLAYNIPSISHLNYLLDIKHRETVSDIVNNSILLSLQDNNNNNINNNNNNSCESKCSKLEIIIKQIVATQKIITEQIDNKGELFKLQNYI